jgi:SAM-dependent methyltransferase
MPAMIDSYHVAAKYYDSAYGAMRDMVDAPFYLNPAKEFGGPVLEIGCGTGRVLLPIAREGIEIHGVDNSGPMLGILKESLARENLEVRGRVALHSGDMRELRLNRKFPLVIIPFRPMQHMFTVADQLRALTSVASHVAEGGMLAFDVFYPKFEVLLLGSGEERLEAQWPSPSDPETTIRRFYRKDAVDKIHQTYSLTFIFRGYRHGRLAFEENDTLKMSYYTYPHLQALFLLVGLEPVAEYGSFDKAPLDNSSNEMIFLLLRTRS